MGVLDKLLAKGYFPKELPPAFTTDSFTNVVTQSTFAPDSCLVATDDIGKLVLAKKGKSHLGRHNLARLDGTSRPLHIPHPSHFFYLCSELDNKWADIEAHLKQATLSISTPKWDSNAIRAVVPTDSGAARPDRRIIDRAQGNTLLITDITNFYGTIYTHSIPWALHTKVRAKNNRHDYNLVGNALDLYVRNGQDGQTSGIPIGTDVSFIIAEIVLSSIDRELQSKYQGLVGFRFYDDYELVCDNELIARQVLADLEDQATRYELALNQRKTKIVRLPDEVDHLWLTELRQFKLSIDSLVTAKAKREQFIDFANTIFLLSKRYPNEPILRYALVKTSTQIDSLSQPQIEQFWTVYQNFLLQVFRSEPQLSHLVAGEFLRYQQKGVQINKSLLKKAIESHIVHYASTRATNEIAWALWMAILFQVDLSDQIAVTLSEIPDNIVAILSLDARNKNLFVSSLNTSRWESRLMESNIYSEDWLLVYEAPARGWLPIQDATDYINKHKCFGHLHSNGVKFYDENSYKNTAAILKRLQINTDLYSA